MDRSFIWDSDNGKVYKSIIKFHCVPMHEIMPIPPSDTDNTTNNDTDELSIESLASIFMPIRDIAVILECDYAELHDRITTPGTEEYRQYHRGKALAKAKIRAQEMQLARLGSPLGVQNVRDNLIEMEEDE